MEFNVINEKKIEFIGGSLKKTNQPKKRKVVWLKRMHYSRYPLTLIPVLDENGTTACETEATIGSTSFRYVSIELLFGDTHLARQLQIKSSGYIKTHFTFTSANTAGLMVETNRRVAPPRDNDVDILEELFKLGENLPPDSLEFTLSVAPFQYDDGDDNSLLSSCDDEKELDIFGKGLKLKRNESGSACLEMTDIELPSEKWWKLWRDREGGATTFSGELSVNVKLGIAAVAELYKKRFERGSFSTTELGAATDLIMLVGGNKDKAKGVKCHKCVLSEMSPVFEVMFQADMLEAKEGTLEIVDFSEPVIRALIEFAYRRNLAQALKNSEVVLDLLQVAEKYAFKDLQDILLHIIWSMPCSWFSVDVARKLIWFGKIAGVDLAEAEIKGFAVLNWYAVKYPEQLIGSKDCASLCENPWSAMKFLSK